MKRFFVLMAILGIAFCFACGDDNGDGSLNLNGSYSGDALKLTYSDVVFPGKTVVFSSQDGHGASLTLNGVIPGELETVISEVELLQDNAGYQLTGKDENIHRAINLTGKIEKGLLVLGVNVKFDNVLIGKWLLNEKKPGSVIWTTVDGESVTLAEITTANGVRIMSLTTKTVATLLPMLMKELTNYLKDISFLADGNLLATYNASESETAADWKSLDLNSIHYYVEDETNCCIYPNVETLASQIPALDTMKIEKSMLQQFLVNGVPLNFDLKEDVDPRTLYMYVDEEYIKQLIPLIKMAGSVVPEDAKIEIPATSGSPLYISLKELLTNLPVALEKTETLEIGLNFIETKDPSKSE